MSKIKLLAAALLLTVSAGISGPMIAQESVIVGGDCVYSEYRNEQGVCHGPTTRLCQGPSDCPRDNN